MKTNKIIKIVALIIGLLIMNTSIKAQLSWYVELLNPGKVRVYVTSNTFCVDQVKFSLKLTYGSQTITPNFSFTDAKIKTLLPGKTYVKVYPIDSKYTKVVGTDMKGMSYTCGGKADDIVETPKKEISGGPGKSIKPVNKNMIFLDEKNTLPN
jgi:hypothetical protein